MTTEEIPSEPGTTFDRLPWHDAELQGWRVTYSSDDEAVVIFDVVFGPTKGGAAEVRFDQVRGIYSDVDLLAKRLCSDHIASARCVTADATDAPFVEQLNERFDLYPGESMEGLFLFSVRLIHPAGSLLVLARSFSVVPVPSS